MSFHKKLSAGNFSLNCFSTASGMISCGSFMNAAKMSAVPPDPAKISQGAEFSKPLQILCSLKSTFLEFIYGNKMLFKRMISCKLGINMYLN